jgi:S1-C subfamily serine protease
MIEGTYRVRCKASKTSYGIVHSTKESAGSAFGVSLAKWGIHEKKYLITAAHVVLQDEKPAEIIEIQIRTDSVKKWVSCKPLIIDKDRDVALLEAFEEIPVAFEMGDEIEIGSSVILSGCPVGITPSANIGFLVSKDPEIRASAKGRIWQVDAPFFSGYSGGPVFSTETGKVVAIGVAGIGTQSGAIQNVAFCVPHDEIKKVLDAHLKLPEK